MNKDEIMIEMLLNQFRRFIMETGTLLESMTDEALQMEVAPGKNRAIYIFGHLTAMVGNMVPVLGIGDLLYPDLLTEFHSKPDRDGLDKFSGTELKSCWININRVLENNISNFSTDEWFSKHTMISGEDFAKDPTRNKLNIILIRTNHLNYHLGQLRLLKNT